MTSQAIDTWTEDRVAELTKLYAEGYSAGIIGEKLGLSRNAIIGKIYRLKLVMPANRITRQRVAAPKVAKPANRSIIRIVRSNGNSSSVRTMTTVETEQYKLRCVEIEPRHLPLIDLELGDCRYPYGDDVVTFCGHPKQDGSSYCVQHHFICNEKPRAPIHRFAGVAA